MVSGRGAARLLRSYATLTQAEVEAGQSRGYLGLHRPFEQIGGAVLSHRVADHVPARGLVGPDAPGTP